MRDSEPLSFSLSLTHSLCRVAVGRSTSTCIGAAAASDSTPVLGDGAESAIPQSIWTRNHQGRASVTKRTMGMSIGNLLRKLRFAEEQDAPYANWLRAY